MANFVIDKSRFNPAQLAQYEELVAIGKAEVDPEANQEEMEEEFPTEDPAKKGCKKPAKKGCKNPAKKMVEEETEVETKKSAPTEFELPDFVKDAIAKSEAFIEEQQKKEQVDLAKKYDILGQKPEELGAQLYELKKSNPDMYNTCISMLDSQVALIEKSPMFAEIGKSGNALGEYNGLSGAEAKADAKAKEIMKADPGKSYTEAIAKAWEDPYLAAEYDAEYFGK